MRILVLGAGAIGGYFGARLVEAGVDVTFLVRPGRRQILAERGLVVKSPAGDVTCEVATVLAEETRSPYDLVLLTCKAYDLDAAISAVTPAMGPKSAVLPLLNGLVHVDTLLRRFGRERVLGGTCQIGAALTPAGEIRHVSPLAIVTFGELDGTRSARAEAIAAELQKGKFKSSLSTRIVDDMWEKFVFLTALAAMSTLTHATIGEIVAAAEGERAMLGMFGECEAVAAAEGHAVVGAAAERMRKMLTDRASGFTASMRRDMEQGGPTEGDHIIGDMIRRAEAKGVATPLLRLALCNLQVYEAKRLRK
jgi:2-dehydropantoate 2-reductase